LGARLGGVRGPGGTDTQKSRDTAEIKGVRTEGGSEKKACGVINAIPDKKAGQKRDEETDFKEEEQDPPKGKTKKENGGRGSKSVEKSRQDREWIEKPGNVNQKGQEGAEGDEKMQLTRSSRLSPRGSNGKRSSLAKGELREVKKKRPIRVGGMTVQRAKRTRKRVAKDKKKQRISLEGKGGTIEPRRSGKRPKTIEDLKLGQKRPGEQRTERWGGENKKTCKGKKHGMGRRR